MDILLIDPPYIRLKGMTTDRGYNVSLTSLAAYLRDAGIENAVLVGDLLMDKKPSIFGTLFSGVNQKMKQYAEGQREYEKAVKDSSHPVWKKLVDVIEEKRPAVVGIAYITPLKYVVEKVAGLIKETDKDIKIIAGAYHPTFCPEEVMQNRDIDYVIRGEGEIPLLALVRELKKDSPKLEQVPGIYYRDKDGNVRNNPGVGLIPNLDELPFPARDLVLNCDYDFYRLHSVLTTRGCPYTCSFCADRRLWGGKVRRRSVENVIDEFRQIKDNYRLDYIDIVDGTFTFDRKYVQKFCEALIDEDLDIKWRCTGRYDNLDEELLQLMITSGCSGLYVGLESGSDRMLNHMDKKMTVEGILRASEMVYRSGIPSITSVLLGLPDEEKADIEATLEAMKKVKTDLIDVNSYIPIPGTPLYDAMSEEDKKAIDWWKTGFKSLDIHFANKITREDFYEYRVKAYQIANNIRRKTIVRLGSKMLFRSIVGLFKSKKKRRPVNN
jgi:anaerobic magnesium-protoporphyrin IX monomethyl ester cyclase